MPFSFSDTLTSPADGSNLGLSSRLDNIKIHVFIGYYSVWIIYIYIYIPMLTKTPLSGQE